MKFPVRFVVFLFVAALVAGFVHAADAVTYPPIKLRGYGTLSGTFTPDGSGGSVLKIVCEDEAKAKLVQAKYVSDLQAFPGVQPVKIAAGGINIHDAYSATGEGIIVAARDGDSVLVFSSPTPEKDLFAY